MGIVNMPVAAEHYWRKAGDNTPLQRLTASYSDPALSSAYRFLDSSGAYSDDSTYA